MSKLKHILGLIALVLLFAACSKDAELFSVEDDIKVEKVAAEDEEVNTEDEEDGIVNPGIDLSGDGEGAGISDDDDEEDDDDHINDDDDDEDDDETNAVKGEGAK